MDFEREKKKWCVRDAIQTQVEKEAWYEWAIRPNEPIPDLPLLQTGAWHPAPLHAFISKILP